MNMKLEKININTVLGFFFQIKTKKTWNFDLKLCLNSIF